MKKLRPGLGDLLVGVALLAAGVGVTVFSHKVVWWGAMLVGGFLILRGGYLLLRPPKKS